MQHAWTSDKMRKSNESASYLIERTWPNLTPNLTSYSFSTFFFSPAYQTGKVRPCRIRNVEPSNSRRPTDTLPHPPIGYITIAERGAIVARSFSFCKRRWTHIEMPGGVTRTVGSGMTEQGKEKHLKKKKEQEQKKENKRKSLNSPPWMPVRQGQDRPQGVEIERERREVWSLSRSSPTHMKRQS